MPAFPAFMLGFVVGAVFAVVVMFLLLRQVRYER